MSSPLESLDLEKWHFFIYISDGQQPIVLGLSVLRYILSMNFNLPCNLISIKYSVYMWHVYSLSQVFSDNIIVNHLDLALDPDPLPLDNPLDKLLV